MLLSIIELSPFDRLGHVHAGFILMYQVERLNLDRKIYTNFQKISYLLHNHIVYVQLDHDIT